MHAGIECYYRGYHDAYSQDYAPQPAHHVPEASTDGTIAMTRSNYVPDIRQTYMLRKLW